MLLAVLILPIPVIIIDIKKRSQPTLACIHSVIVAGAFELAVMVISAANGRFVGDDIAAEMKTSMSSMPDKLTNMVSVNDIVSQFPAVMLLMAAVIAWIEYMLLSKIVEVNGQEALKMIPLRNMAIPKSGVMAWFAIYIASWIMAKANMSAGDTIYLNVNLLFTFAFAIQGIGLIFMFCYKKNIPKVFAGIIVIVCGLHL